MKVKNVHQRSLAAPPEQVAGLFGDMDRLWPDPVPEKVGDGLQMGLMLWLPVERPGSPKAYRVASPSEVPAEHWFEVAPDGEGGTILRHTIAGDAQGKFEPIWRERIEPVHDFYIEALFDRAQEAVS
jgi:hypothetical protein